MLKPLRLKGLKLWSSEYEVFQFSQLGVRKGKARGRQEDKKPSETATVLSSILSTFTTSIESSKRLGVLGLFGLKLAPKTWARLGTAIENSSIQTISFNNCEISEKELEAMFQSIGSMTSLNALDLSYNKITDGYLVGRIISKQGERRDISKWEGGLRGATVDIPRGLSEMYLSDNQLGDNGWEKILSSVLSDNWLRLIDCKRNGITRKSVRATLRTLSENKSILVADLRGNIKFERGCLKAMEIVDRNFDYLEKDSEECMKYTQLFEIIVNELEFPCVCELKFVKNAMKKLKIKGSLEILDRKLNSTVGKALSEDEEKEEEEKEKVRKKVNSALRN